MRTLLVFFCSLILFFSCNQIDDCQLNPYSEWLSVQVKHRTKAPLYFDSLTVEGLGRVAYDPTFALSSFSVPLDFAKDQLSMGFYTDSTDYFFTMSHDKEVRVYEENCDPVIRYFDLAITEANCKKITLLSQEINVTKYPVTLEITF